MRVLESSRNSQNCPTTTLVGGTKRATIPPLARQAATSDICSISVNCISIYLLLVEVEQYYLRHFHFNRLNF